MTPLILDQGIEGSNPSSPANSPIVILAEAAPPADHVDSGDSHTDVLAIPSRGIGVPVTVAVKSKKRRAGTGSVFLLDGEWVGEYRARDPHTGLVSKRRLFRPTRATAELALSRMLRGRPLEPVARAPKVRPQPRSTKRTVVWRVLADAERMGWTRDVTADVIVAATSPARVRLGVYGPCFYCGDWLANSVDHVTPRTRGGGDNRGNLVSACMPCNIRKGALTADEFRSRSAASS